MTRNTGDTKPCSRCKGTGSVDCLHVDQGRCWSCTGSGVKTWVSLETWKVREEESRKHHMNRVAEEAETLKRKASEMPAHRPHAKAQMLRDVETLRAEWLRLANRVGEVTRKRGSWE